MIIVGQISTGKALWWSGILPTDPTPERCKKLAATPENIPLENMATITIPNDGTAQALYQQCREAGVGARDLKLTWDGDQVIDAQPPTPAPTFYVHTTLTGGIQSPAGTLYLKNDGADALQVHAELRDGPDPAASAAVTQLDSQDISAMWALELVNVETGVLADTPLVQMSAGVINVSYTTTIAPCEVELAEDRLQPIGDYQLKLAQPVRFKIVRPLI